MQINKDVVADKLRSDGEFDRAQQAECALPRRVDTERDAALLHQFDVDIAGLRAAATEGAGAEPGDHAAEDS